MAKEGRTTVVPRLRFPEFRGRPEWENDKLEKLISTVTPPAKLPSSSYQPTGKFPIIDQSQEPICGWTDEAGAVIAKPLPLIVFGDHTCALKFIQQPFAQGADGIKILKAEPAISIDYLFHALSHQPLVMEDYKRHFSMLKERRVFYPEIETGEQQKIADCLTSLDELIAAQGQKVESLKTYKRGLMQQLFPREGETLPRLRFPEFQYALADFVSIGQFAKVTTGAKDTQNKVDGGAYPFFVRSQNVERIDSFSYEGEAILTSGDGVGVGENYHYINGKFDFHQRVYCIYDFEHDTSGQFFFHYFSTHFKKRVKQMSAKNSVDSVRMAMITEMPVWMPQIAEQQRIAGCLSSLDDRIADETKKLDMLKTHKKGLMQQLFPSPNEA